jgi:arylsulfatase A-like enzyme
VMTRLRAPWVLAAAILFNFVAGPNTSHAAPPNVLMIVGDDWGWTDFGFMGHKVVKTPNLDRFAKEGALFPNGYVPTSLCRASLATILTGQYAHQHKICCNDPPVGVDRAEMLPFLQNSPTIPRLLKDAGYRSFQTGKFWEGHYRNGGFTDGMTTKGRHGEEGLVIGRQTLKPITDFIEAGKGPWFIWYAPMMPHLPHTPPQRLLDKYKAERRDPRLAAYYAMCEWTDETVGTLLKYLDDHKLAENTLVVFVFDNGWVQAEGPARPGDQFTTRSKNSPYDMGVRTPVILRWPGVVKPGMYTDLVSTVDLAPTVLTACGVKVPPAIAGVSLLDTAAGKGPLKRTAVFGEIYLHTAKRLDNPAANLTHRWVREGDWKLIVPVNAKDGRVELFNIADDPLEKQNLAAQKSELVKHLRNLLEKSWQPEWKSDIAPPRP